MENNTLKITSLQIASMRKQALSWGVHGRMAKRAWQNMIFACQKGTDTPLKIAFFIRRGAPSGMKDSSENRRGVFIRGGEL